MFSVSRRLAGMAVHLYTASGSVLALLIVIAAFDGNAVTALWIGLVALVVDGTDGMLARHLRVKETIPWFDGARLDDIVDYLTYVFAPMVLLWTTGPAAGRPTGWVLAALPLLASSYQFCRVDAKTDDHFFLGFPSYWNVVAFYAIVLDLGRVPVGDHPRRPARCWSSCRCATSTPPAPSAPHPQPGAHRRVAGHLRACCSPSTRPEPAGGGRLSLAYLGYYLAVSVYLTVAARRRRRSETGAGTPLDASTT